MAIYELTAGKIVEVPRTTFATLAIRERDDMQRLLREFITIVSPDTMVLAEEFGEWEDSRRRIDLLGLDKDRHLVVIELKRTEDGGHMELQALRYAAMVSTMKFEQAIEAHKVYLEDRGFDASTAEQRIHEFLGIETGPVAFSDKVKIVLASADFSKEITSSVLWLNQQGLDVTCVRMRPHSLDGHVLLDVQQVIPLPEAAEFQIAIREKSMEMQAAETAGRDFTKYRLRTSLEEFPSLNKRRFIFQVVREAVRQGIGPDEIKEAVPWRRSGMFLSLKGDHRGEAILASSPGKAGSRYFCDDDEVLRFNGSSYLMNNQWGIRTEEAVLNILALLPTNHGVDYETLS